MRLIDADAFKEFVKEKCSYCTSFIGEESVLSWIDEAPTIEPSGDLVSREDAIKAVEQEYKIDKGYMADDYTYGFNQAIQYVSDIILHDLPSAEPSGDLVSRADAMGAVQDHFNANGFKGYNDGQKMMDRIKALPSAEASKNLVKPKKIEFDFSKYRPRVRNKVNDCTPSADRPKGEWINREDSADVFFLYKYECSVCGGKAVLNSTYCPNCGAEMNGE